MLAQQHISKAICFFQNKFAKPKKIFSSKINVFYLAICLLALGFGLYVRLRGLPGEMYFYGDQGQDLLAALRIVRGEFYPLVGPLLSVRNFFTPPTYYYLLALLLYVFKSESVIIYFFVLMNVLTVIFFALYVKERSNNLAATVFFSLFIFLCIDVEMSHSIWQPFPMLFFISMSFWFISHAQKRASMGEMFIAIVFFVTGLTSYVGAVLLLPVFIYECSVFYINKYRKPVAIIFSAINVLVVFLVFSATWIFYEIVNKFPTYYATIQPLTYRGDSNSHFVFYDTIGGIFQRTTINVVSMYRLVIPSTWQGKNLLTFDWIFLALFFILSLKLIFNRVLLRRFRVFLTSVGFPYLLLGASFLLFFSSPPAYQHIVVLLPFLFLIICYFVSLLISGGTLIIRVLSLLFLGYIFLANFCYPVSYSSCCQTYGNVLNLYRFLNSDIKSRGLPVDVYYFQLNTPTDSGNYEAQPLWYILKKYNNYKVKFNDVGNDTIRYDILPDSYKYTYLICYPASLRGINCWNSFSSHFTNGRVINYSETGPYSIFLVKPY